MSTPTKSTTATPPPVPQITKILFPVDFSESCTGAARYVEAIAGQFQAEILLLHAVTNGERVLAEELLPQRKQQLDSFCANEFKYFTTRRECVIAHPADAVTEAAVAFQPDLVMLPTHGLGYFRRHLLGSVTAKVLHDLQCPVWTSAHAENAPPLEAIHCRRILCAVDLTGNSRAVLAWASWLAAQYDANLAVVHAALPVAGAVEAWNLAEQLQEAVLSRAVGDVADLQAHAGTAAETFVTTGTPSAVISATASAWGADLLVIGRHTAEGLAGQLFQNAYGILTDSPCPVISI